MEIKEIYLSKDVLDINADIIGICNYKCPYCYFFKTYSRSNGVIWSKRQIDTFADAVNCTPSNTTVSLLGGEPTLHPLLPYLCQRLERSTTVFSNISRVVKLPGDVTISASWHATDLGMFKDNVLRYKDSNPIVVTIMASEYEFTMNAIEFCIKNDLHYDIGYIDECNVIVDQPVKNCFMTDKGTITPMQLYKHNLNHFKGWSCQQSYVLVTIHGDVYTSCLTDKKIFNVFNHPEKLASLKPFVITCDKDECRNDCWIAQYKHAPDMLHSFEK